MVRALDGVSPQKPLRRSARERCAVYRSLEENSILNSSLLDSLLTRANRMKRESIPVEPGYTRSGRPIARFEYDTSDDEVIIPNRKRPARSDRIIQSDDDPHPKQSSARIQKRSRHDYQNGASNHDHERDESLYDRVKRSRSESSQNVNGVHEHEDQNTPPKNGMVENGCTSSPSHSRRITRQQKLEDEAGDNEVEEDDEKEDEEEEGPRQYSLRTQRKTVERFVPTIRLRPTREREMRRDNRDQERWVRSSRRSEFKRRMCRSDSSSTGDDEPFDLNRRSRRREGSDDRFERRKEASMMKARNRFVPLNLTAKDLSSSRNVIRERIRQTGASCSDVDPMGIDKEVTFDKIGGLGLHIQSLKEIVLFPLLYPDVFQKFDISPPKGVIFYGPPGTGKTMVARALANECSKGDKKVAFFMRKGADCLSKWVGESERQLRILFDQAYALRPSIIFFDEIDGLAPVRSSRQDQIHSSIVSTLLALMDGLDNRGDVIVIGATNRLDALDPALRRPGRFDRELNFTLPDHASRRQIIEIHTSKWGTNKPEPELLEWLASNTSGYCGADLRFLCTEAILIALRARYPHIYLSSDRLKLDADSIKVEKKNLLDAMKRIVPASRRDLSIPSRPLDERTSILLSTPLNALLLTRIPNGYRSSQTIQSLSNNPLEKVVRALEPPPAVHAVRLLLCGSDHYADAGQTSYMLPALLSRLDHLPVFSLAINKIFADGRPEEAFSVIFQSALRAATSGPCILLLPSIDQWMQVVSPSIAHMLNTALDQISGFTSILFLATCECSYNEAPVELTQIFWASCVAKMTSYPVEQRRKYFEHIIAGATIPPKTFDDSKYPPPEKAKKEDAPIRKLSPKEAAEVEKLYENQLREFRIFLRDQLGRLVRDRRFAVFAEPVDVEEAEDYYEVIQNPMCLTDMMAKVDQKQYIHPDQFLGDIKLIVRNALEYNPADNLYSKTIRHNASALRDIVEEYFEKEFDEEFVQKLEETAQLLKDANVETKSERLLILPNGFTRKTPWTVSIGFKSRLFANESVSAKIDPTSSSNEQDVAANDVESKEENASQAQRPAFRPKKKLSFRRRLRGNYSFPSSRKKKKARENSHNHNQSVSESPMDVAENDEGEDSVHSHFTDSDEELSPTVPFSAVLEKQDQLSSPSTESKSCRLIVDTNTLDKVVDLAVSNSEDVPVTDLERLAAEMTHTIDRFRDEWNRSDLGDQLLRLVTEWEPTCF